MFNTLIDFLFYHTPIFYLIQSVWRDEAFSYFMAKPSLFQIIQNTANDFNPPLYYFLLHGWIGVVGKSDIALRFLSFFAHSTTTYVAYLFGRTLFSRNFGFYLAACTFLNPMLLYYAFELRMYAFYVLFTFGSTYFFYTKQWKWYIISTILGLYTHSFFILIPFSFIIYLFITKQRKKGILVKTLMPGLFFIPWLMILVNQFQRSVESWVFPTDLQLIRSAMGNLFTNYDGTPGYLWEETALLSLVLLTALCFLLYKKPKLGIFFIIPIVVPLFLVLGYSFFRRPIYVNRYVIFVSVFEVIGVAAGIWCIKQAIFRKIAVLTSLVGIIVINLYLSPYKKKTDFKSTFMEINSFAKPEDHAYAATPIGLLETAYYFKYPDHVFVYNSHNTTIPNFIGVTVVFPDISKSRFPPPPARTFLIYDDASYDVVIKR